MKPPRFIRRGKNTIRHADYRGWHCRVIQLEAATDWLAHVRHPKRGDWGSLCASQSDAETWCKDRVDELERDLA